VLDRAKEDPGMLVELSVVEQRYLAVREVLDGARVTDVATRYGIDRRSVHRWLIRYVNEGLGALADRSSKPDRCPHQTAPATEARIVALRRAHPGWGPRTILARLRREMEVPPSRSAIYRCLLRHRLIDPKPRRRRLKDYKRWERSRPMELWQMDVMGGVRLVDGTQLSVVTGIDDHSRFCVMARVVLRATARPVCEALLEGLSRHGVPEQILTDGKVFTGKLARKPATVAFDRICVGNGIRHLLTAPYSPTTTGKIERLHKTMRKELLEGRRFASIHEAQTEISTGGSPTTTPNGSTRPSATSPPSGGSSSRPRPPPRSSIQTSGPSRRPHLPYGPSAAGWTGRGASASSSTATTWVATWPARASPWSPLTGCSTSPTTGW
jgi:transposase InsO family protein